MSKPNWEKIANAHARRFGEVVAERNQLIKSVERLQAQLAEAQAQQRALSDAYVRLRTKIPGALSTPHAPSAQEVWAITEAALDKMSKGILPEEIFFLRAAVENLRSPERPPSVIEGAWRIAEKLEKLAKRLTGEAEPSS